MRKILVNVFSSNYKKLLDKNVIEYLVLRRSSTNGQDATKKKTPHAYRNVHPWKSLKQFTKSLVSGVIHNEDGLVAVNKPYGISGRIGTFSKDNKKITGIVNDVDYTLTDAAPHIAAALGYPLLKLVKAPEKFTSGVAIFAANDKVENAVIKSLNRALGMRILPKTYWIVTIKVPNEIKGELRMAMRIEENSARTMKSPVIIKSWSRREMKKGNMKIFNAQYKVISNSSENLSSLIEIKASTAKWHALRLFASTVLHSPVLGDNIYGSRVKCILGKWMNIHPFTEAARELPKLNRDILKILQLFPGKEALIPAHVHLREIYLPTFLQKDKELILTAPPMPEFVWTCRQLQFKHELFDVDDNFQVLVNENLNIMDRTIRIQN